MVDSNIEEINMKGFMINNFLLMAFNTYQCKICIMSFTGYSLAPVLIQIILKEIVIENKIP